MNDITAKRFLVVIETQKVKSYLFASPIMRETRGGSVLLDALNRKETKRILRELGHVRYEEIYLGGGSGRVLFENMPDAENFKKAVLELYRQETVNARVSVEIVKRETKAGKDESFAEWVSRGVMMTQQSKSGRVEGVPVLAGRWIRPCTSCGSEPAEMMLSEHGEHWLCLACLLKRKEIKSLYRVIKGNNVLKSSSELAPRYTDNFIFSTLAKQNEEANCQVFLPQDFDDIGQYSRPSNYMGFIYADGNRMGETIKEIGRLFPKDEDAKRAYKAFSEIVDQATREAAVEAVLKVVGLKESETADGMPRFLPAEFIMAGGDDLMLAVPSHNAMDVAVLFIERFQKMTKKLQEDYVKNRKLPKPFAEDGLTTSAGVVIAHTHYPISDLMTLAGELMKLAKKKSSELHTQRCETGTLDFLVLTEAGSESVKERRVNEYTKQCSSGLEVKLTERPYTTAEAQWLLKTIRALKDPKIPRSKLKALYPVLFQSLPQAQFDALRIRERLKATGELEESSQLYQLCMKDLSIFPFRQPDQKDEKHWTTPLTEIIELYDFTQAGPERIGENA
ncbi:MAG TPA: hypothetical protein VJ440_00565 [Candidatus Brocadiaceae bacterium]|nr:hypothetical protein [Candidatus Brocadiaceae bacterium]